MEKNFLNGYLQQRLETLSIVAYKQPITKGEIESIRGVNSDYSIQKLLEKELIIITGRNEDMPGKPLVYATSKSFMDYFGINSAEDLPKLKEVISEGLSETSPSTYTPASPKYQRYRTAFYFHSGYELLPNEEELHAGTEQQSGEGSAD